MTTLTVSLLYVPFAVRTVTSPTSPSFPEYTFNDPGKWEPFHLLLRLRYHQQQCFWRDNAIC